jgi:hypothetical protein
MKKLLILLFFMQAFFMFAQEIYTAGCIYENDKPIPAYWMNQNIEILGIPLGTYGEATAIVSFKDKLLVFGYMASESNNRKSPVVWQSKLEYSVLYYPYWNYVDCHISKVYVFNENLYVLGYLIDYNGHYSTIVWKNFYPYQIIKETYQNTIILDMEWINDRIILVGYTNDYNSFYEKSYVVSFIEQKFPFFDDSDPSPFYKNNFDLINIVRKINNDIYYCGIKNNRFVVFKNEILLYWDETYQESAIMDIMEINGKIYLLASLNDGGVLKLVYGENTVPNTIVCNNTMIHSAEIVGIKGDRPIIIFTEFINSPENSIIETKNFKIAIDNSIIKLLW